MVSLLCLNISPFVFETQSRNPITQSVMSYVVRPVRVLRFDSRAFPIARLMVESRGHAQPFNGRHFSNNRCIMLRFHLRAFVRDQKVRPPPAEQKSRMRDTTYTACSSVNSG